MDIIPEPKVNPEAYPWARAITQLVRDLIGRINFNNQELVNANKSLTGSVNLLTEQVAMLQSFKTYTSIVTGSFFSTVIGTTMVTSGSLTANFTRDCIALVSVSGAGSGYANGSAGAGVNSLKTVSVGAVTSLNGIGWVSTASSFNSSSTTVTSSAHSGQIQVGGTIGGSRIMNIPAGTQTINVQWSVVITGTSGNAGVTDPTLTVTVIG